MIILVLSGIFIVFIIFSVLWYFASPYNFNFNYKDEEEYKRTKKQFEQEQIYKEACYTQKFFNENQSNFIKNYFLLLPQDIKNKIFNYCETGNFKHIDLPLSNCYNDPCSSGMIAVDLVMYLCKHELTFPVEDLIKNKVSSLMPSLPYVPDWRVNEIINKMIYAIKEALGL